MRKDSHICLSKYLLKNLDSEKLLNHKTAFFIGSVLPDFVPTFITVRHEYDRTIKIIKKKIDKIFILDTNEELSSFSLMKRLGVVSHFMADYFTFPHNEHFAGGFFDHCSYEKQLAHKIKSYLKEKSENLNSQFVEQSFNNLEDIFKYIHEKHIEYINKKRNFEDDCFFILNVSRNVVIGIISLLRQEHEALIRDLDFFKDEYFDFDLDFNFDSDEDEDYGYAKI